MDRIKENNITLVDITDREIGECEKMEAHERGLLHRAFSVFIFNGGKLLMQKRASHKYHCGGLWTNTCCSHPRPGEAVDAAAIRRLKEELNINIDSVKEIDSFAYRATFDNGLIEYEYDHVLVSEYDGSFEKNPSEVEDVKWISVADVLEDIRKNPESYTPWFITALEIAVNKKALNAGN